MSANKRLGLSVIWLVLGTALFLCGAMEIIDPYWSGMGGGFLGVGIVQTFRQIRYRRDPEYRQNVDIQNTDERNKFIAGKAWTWAGYLYVLLNGIGLIGLRLAGFDQLSLWAAYSVCIIMILYWISYLLLRRKY